jgi:hypothetical protein
MSTTLEVWNHIQRQLFPMLQEELGPLTEKDNQFVEVIGLVPLGLFLESYRWVGNGCPPHERAWLVHAFIAKALCQFPTTRALLDALKARPVLQRLCGWESLSDLPHESTFSRRLGHVPIIDPNPRRGEKIPLDPVQAQRFQQRTSSERVNSLLKECFGGRFVRVRGAKKVMAHLMFGLIALTAMQLYQLIL